MKPLYVRLLRGLLCAFCLFSVSTVSRASHIVGGDLYYSHVSGSTYKITLVLYGDCAPMSSAAFSTLPTGTPHICIFDGSTFIDTINLAIDTPATGTEILTLCSTLDTTQCTDPASPIPGIKKFIYSATYTLPHASSVWRFIFNGYTGSSSAGRASGITNISSAGGTTMELTDTLNSIAGNSSPLLTVTQRTYFCLSHSDYYNPGAVDPDTDSLFINLAPAINATASGTCSSVGTAVLYSGSFTPTDPLATTAGTYSMNAHTGDMYFYPNVLQRAVVVYNIREYRSGVLVGTSQREMTVLVVPCSGCAVLSEKNLEVENKIDIFPNPAMDVLNIQTNKQDFSSCVLTNTLGTVLLQQPISSSQTQINIKSLPAGVYYLILNGRYGNVVRKFLKM